MNSIHCPDCETAMPETARFCASCGRLIPAHESTPVKAGQQSEDYLPPSPQALPTEEEFDGENPDYLQDDLSAQALVDAAEHHLTWHKELDAPVEPEDAHFPPRPSQMHPIVPNPLPPQRLFSKRRTRFTSLFWARLLAAGILLFVAIFGIFFSIGHGFFGSSAGSHEPTLQASASSLAPGGTLTLHGSYFTPNKIVALSRDQSIPIVDTHYLTRITTDSKGTFTDTITISAEWQSGVHTLNAEDAVLHKIARFPIFVTGDDTGLRPAHFTISTTTLDMGAGDFATHSTQQIILSNTGGGEITWQGNTDQSWLQITPKQGTIADIMKAQVTVAVDRSHLKLGSYTARLNFLSNAGNGTVNVKMSVVPLNAGQDAVLDVSPAVLAFTSTDGGSPPPSQTVTVSNLGVRALSWNGRTNAPWLSISPQAGEIQKALSSTGGLITATPVGTTQTVRVSINTSTLLPGTYSGMITISGQGEVKDSPQNIAVTITINPQCMLQVTPAMLSFASAYGQAAPGNQSISVAVSQGCTQTLAWSATTGAQWMQLNTSSGTTPTSPIVSINDIGLQPGTYNSSIVFTSSTGTDTVPITFTLGQPTEPVINISTNALTYNGVAGQGDPPPQTVVITNSAGGTLNWQATFVATNGGNWLNMPTKSGSLAAHQSASLSITAHLNGLPPYPAYSGAITISGTDGTGNTAAGSPEMIQVSLNVQAACAISATQDSFSFNGISGQANPPAQSLTITASGACAHSVAWSVTPNAAWLSATPTGVVTPTSPSSSSISVSSAGLKFGPYNSSVTLVASDSVTHQAIGSPIQIPVSFLVQPACSLAAPSDNALNFSTEAGQSPPTQTFTISASGTCSGNVVITPNIALANGTGWLNVSPTTASIPSGGSATFTVTVTGTTLSATNSPYNGSIALNATNGGTTIVGSPQNVGVTVAVSAAPAFSASAGAQTIHGTMGLSAPPINIANSGGGSLNWSATLNNAPAFVGLSSTSGTLAAGVSDETNIVVTNAAAVVSGDYSASVTLTATDAATGNAIGTPITVPITISVAQPSMQLSSTTLNYSTTVGTNPAAQSLAITNNGGATLTWTAGTPSASWVTLDSTSGSDASGASSTINFTVNVAGLVTSGSPYSATIVITPSYGQAVTVTINLTLSPVTLSPTPTVGLSPTPTINVTVSPTPTIAPTVTPTKTSSLV